MMLSATRDEVLRFLSHVELLRCGCWMWWGARSGGAGNRCRYGSFRHRGTSVRAHRFSCEALMGVPCPPGYHRDHTCGFTLCVNPMHLEVVTHAVNQERKLERLQTDATLRRVRREPILLLDLLPDGVSSYRGT